MANCENCSSNNKCSSEKKETCGIENNPLNSVKNIIGVMSGKGGVGKSTVSVMLAKQLIEKGYKVGIMDADITGPSIPRLLGIQDKRATPIEAGLIPYKMEDGLKVMSINLLIEDENQPVLWRGPMIGNMVKQFWTDVIWEDLDYLVIDMPPGTGDVALTVMQSIPINGIVMLSVPQDMVSMIVSKAINMTKKMDIDVIGVIENMSYIKCPDCDKKIRFFEGENVENFLKDLNVKLLGELPMCKEIVNISKTNVNNISPEIKSLFNNITENILQGIK